MEISDEPKEEEAPTEQNSEPKPVVVKEIHESQMTLSEIIRFIIFTVVFVIVILNQVKTQFAYHISAGVRQYFTDDNDDYPKIYCKDDVISWIIIDLIPLLQAEYYYEDWSQVNDTYQRVAFYNRLITPIRFVQKRVKLQDNPYHRTNNIYPKRWAISGLGLYESNSGESKATYGTGTMFEYDSTIGVRQSGGFQYLSETNTTTQEADAYEVIVNEKWIDNQTAAMYVDFVMYNGHWDMLTYAAFQFWFDESGLVTTNFDVRSMDYMFYRTPLDQFRAFFEAIYVILLLLYTGIELFLIKVDIVAQKVALQSQGINVNSARVIMFWGGVKKHFGSLWNILNTASIILSYVNIALWISVANNSIAHLSSFNNLTSLQNDLLDTLSVYKLYTELNGINLLLIFFRLLRYLGKFERIRLLHRTLVRSKNEIFYFSCLLLGVFISFVIFSHVAFGGFMEEFSQVGFAFASCFLILFDNIDGVVKVLDTNFDIGAFFIICFTLFINFILLSMFIAIIGNAYGEELEKLEQSKKNKKAEEQKHIIFSVIDYGKDLYFRVLSLFSKKRALILKYKTNEEDEHYENPDEVVKSKNPYIDYNEAKLWGAQIDHEVLTDKEKYVKITESTLMFSKKLWAALIFVIFAVIYTVTLLYQQDITTRHELLSTFSDSIEIQTYDGKYRLEDVHDYNDLSRWLYFAFWGNFKKSYTYNMQQNYLVGQNFNTTTPCAKNGPIRFTIRKVDTEENQSDLFKEVQPRSRYPTYSAFETHPPHEYTKSAVLNCEWKYKGDVSLYKGGGYIFYFFPDQDDYYTQVLTIVKDHFFNDTMNSLLIDFVLYNGDINYFTYVGFIAEMYSGGEILFQYYIWPMRLKMYATPGDGARAFFELVFVLLLLYHMAITVLTIRRDYINYEAWRSRFYEILTTEQKRKRNHAKPEWLRRINNILTPFVIFDVASYMCSWVCIGLYLRYLTLDVIDYEMISDDEKFHDKFAEAANILEQYLNWSAFNILFIYFRILNYVSFNKALSFLQDTVKTAMVDIAYFLVMIIVILLGFVFFAYLSFGHTLLNYSSIDSSFMVCFSMIIGEFNFPELAEGDLVMSYIFFFTFMIFFQFILLNIFIAILERAYTKVKEAIGKEDERTDYVESLLVYFVSKIKKLLSREVENREPIEENKELAVCVFNRIPDGTEEEDDPKAWAIGKSDEIILERHKRAEIKASLDTLFTKRKLQEIEGRAVIFGGTGNLEDEFRARMNYWDYLRIGFLTYLSHEKKIKIKTEEKIKESVELYDSYIELLKDRDQLIETIRPLESAVEALKDKNFELNEEIQKMEEMIKSNKAEEEGPPKPE